MAGHKTKDDGGMADAAESDVNDSTRGSKRTAAAGRTSKPAEKGSARLNKTAGGSGDDGDDNDNDNDNGDESTSVTSEEGEAPAAAAS
eukprot:jgi/Hompol1/4468/HPOL_007122-RA